MCFHLHNPGLNLCASLLLAGQNFPPVIKRGSELSFLTLEQDENTPCTLFMWGRERQINSAALSHCTLLSFPICVSCSVKASCPHLGKKKYKCTHRAHYTHVLAHTSMCTHTIHTSHTHTTYIHTTHTHTYTPQCAHTPNTHHIHIPHTYTCTHHKF